MLRATAVALSLLVLGLYLALAARGHGFSLLGPRGGALTLSVSLLAANLAIWKSEDASCPQVTRFTLAAGAWIWIAVQLFGVVHLLERAG